MNFLVACMILLFFHFAHAYEVYDKSQDRLFGVRSCTPDNGQPNDNVIYISCAAKNSEKTNASKGSSCTNYQSNTCEAAPDMPPAMTGDKQRPWNYFDNSNTPASMRPAGEVQGQAFDELKKKPVEKAQKK